MLQSAVHPSYSLRERKLTGHSDDEQEEELPMADYDDDDGSEELGSGKGRCKSRRELPAGAVNTLKAWLLSPEHFTHPYPTPQDQAMLMQKTGIDKKQLKNWFTNARRRIWKPMLKKQIEQGKLTTTSGAGLMIPHMGGASVQSSMDNPHSVQAMRVHYQQAVEHNQSQSGQTDIYGNQMYNDGSTNQYYISQPDAQTTSHGSMASNNSIGTLPQLSSNVNLNKTDSHAVLMELFARDQDLVRQATESARSKADPQQQQGGVASQPPMPAQHQQQQQQQQQFAQSAPMPSGQHPMKATSQRDLSNNVPTLNSWPHFSSITSLNNLGTIPGVKSITSLSGTDVAGKGSFNRMGNLAQVKSMESMGRNDSYAFLEVFFGDRSSNNLSGMGGMMKDKNMKQSGEDEGDIGLSLEDESPTHTSPKKDFNTGASGAPQPAPMNSADEEYESGHLKRHYDDALAARGLLAVSRSCERLTDLDLPPKIQRTLSQEFIKQNKHLEQSHELIYSYASSSVGPSEHASSQYAGIQPVESRPGYSAENNETDGHVKVSTSTVCAICQQPDVDTQLRPCGHMFHERCLKPSLQTPMGPPKCPVDEIPMHSAVLAIPTEEAQKPQVTATSSWSNGGQHHTFSAENTYPC
ncbi:hypothetical protein MPSEU_000103800 [Mayamaea pseudoterrestris]|nr:hypothetical protein MPSEU_000103800 [Mayamaea pseudoterrestris]